MLLGTNKVTSLIVASNSTIASTLTVTSDNSKGISIDELYKLKGLGIPLVIDHKLLIELFMEASRQIEYLENKLANTTI